MEATSARELFILGRIAARPTHGHEIMRTLRASRSDLWVELSEKHVYYVLRKLERDGLVTVSEQREGNFPARKVYAITPAGRVALAEMLTSEGLLRSMPYSDFDVVFGMLGYTDVLPDAAKDEVLHRRRDFLTDLLDQVTQAREALADRAEAGAVQFMVLDKTGAVARAELDWLEDVMERIARDGWDPIRPVGAANEGERP